MREPGGGCQFLGTAATSQVVAEALGLRCRMLHLRLRDSLSGWTQLRVPRERSSDGSDGNWHVAMF